MRKFIYLMLPMAICLGCMQQNKKSNKPEVLQPTPIDSTLAAQLQINTDCLILQSENWKTPSGDKIKFSLAAQPMDVKHPTFMDGFYLLTQTEGKTKCLTLPKGAGGYAQGSTISLIANKTQEMPWILVTTKSGGSGGYKEFYLYNLNNKSQPLQAHSEKFAQNHTTTGKFLKGFQAEVLLDQVGIFTLGVEKDKNLLVEEGVYDKDGNLLNKEITPWLGGYWSINCKADSKGLNMELKQPIIGAFHAHKIGIFETKWRYEDGKWEIQSAGCSSEIRINE